VTGARSLEQQERRFALALLVPALAVLVLTTTAPLVYLGWNSLHRIDLGMPWLSGFAGVDNFAKMGSDPRFWNSLALTGIYTASTVVLQVIVGLSLALLVLQIPKGQGLLASPRSCRSSSRRSSSACSGARSCSRPTSASSTWCRVRSACRATTGSAIRNWR
jgi:hypothetical protein